jgi:hypothetical protein
LAAALKPSLSFEQMDRRIVERGDKGAERLIISIKSIG